MGRNIFAAIAVTAGIISAQSISSQLTGSAGGDAVIAGDQVAWSMGEAVIGSTAPSDIAFGFQENYEDPSTVAVAAKPALQALRMVQESGRVKIYFGENPSAYSVRVFNSRGRVLANFETARGQKEMSLSTRDFTSSLVFLNIYGENGKLIRAFKFVGR